MLYSYPVRPSPCDHQKKRWSIIYPLMVQLMLTRVLVATLALALGAAISQSAGHCGGSITSSGAQQSSSQVCPLYSHSWFEDQQFLLNEYTYEWVFNIHTAALSRKCANSELCYFIVPTSVCLTFPWVKHFTVRNAQKPSIKVTWATFCQFQLDDIHPHFAPGWVS